MTDQTPLIPISDQENVLHCAFRYALGRQSYIVGFIQELIVATLPRLSEQTRQQMAREIREADTRGDLGCPHIDGPRWRTLADQLAPAPLNSPDPECPDCGGAGYTREETGRYLATGESETAESPCDCGLLSPLQPPAAPASTPEGAAPGATEGGQQA